MGVNVVLGAGPVGLALAERLVALGRPVRVVTRRSEPRLPDGVEHTNATLEDPAEARGACAGAGVVFGCVGMDYTGWPRRWPQLMAGMLAGAEGADAPLIFADNLYMYGPVDGPLREDLPLTTYGTKPATRAAITGIWRHACSSGRVPVVALRASDFYGPGVTMAMLGEMVAKAALAGKTANLPGDPTRPHSFSYVPDFARGLISLADAADAVTGQAYHLPNAPAVPVAEVVAMMYRACGQEPSLRPAPDWLLRVMGLFNANLREMGEMLYQWKRPFVVDHARFAARFWDDPTPLEVGVAETMRWYRERG